jgi:FkbM family methyltransferase
VFRRLQALAPDIPINFRGTEMFVSPLRDASWIALGERLEEKTMEEFCTALRKLNVSLFFDIGANVGAYSWVALQEGIKTVIMFEPDKTNARLLRKTLKKNCLKSCYLFEAALSCNSSIRTFFVDKASGATGSLLDNSASPQSLHRQYGMDGDHGEQFDCITLCLDVFTNLAKGKKVPLKIDVEGAELDVLSGAEEFLKQVRPVVLIESFANSGSVESFFKGLHHTKADLGEGCNYLYVPITSAC